MHIIEKRLFVLANVTQSMEWSCSMWRVITDEPDKIKVGPHYAWGQMGIDTWSVCWFPKSALQIQNVLDKRQSILVPKMHNVRPIPKKLRQTYMSYFGETSSWDKISLGDVYSIVNGFQMSWLQKQALQKWARPLVFADE